LYIRETLARQIMHRAGRAGDVATTETEVRGRELPNLSPLARGRTILPCAAAHLSRWILKKDLAKSQKRTQGPHSSTLGAAGSVGGGVAETVAPGVETSSLAERHLRKILPAAALAFLTLHGNSRG